MRRIELSPFLTALVAVLALAAICPPVMSQERGWRRSLGLSLIATEGNSDTLSLGLDGQLERAPAPWGFAVRGKALRQEDDEGVSAERYLLDAGVERTIFERTAWFLSGGFEQDERSGVDLRSQIASGLSFNLAEGPVTWFSVEFGLSYVREEPVLEGMDAQGGAMVDERLEEQSFIGAIAALDYERRFSVGSGESSFRQRLELLPNLDHTDDYRITSESVVRAAFTESFAIELGVEVRYDSEPLLRQQGGVLEELESTDLATTVAIVFSR